MIGVSQTSLPDADLHGKKKVVQHVNIFLFVWKYVDILRVQSAMAVITFLSEMHVTRLCIIMAYFFHEAEFNNHTEKRFG